MQTFIENIRVSHAVQILNERYLHIELLQHLFELRIFNNNLTQKQNKRIKIQGKTLVKVAEKLILQK